MTSKGYFDKMNFEAGFDFIVTWTAFAILAMFEKSALVQPTLTIIHTEVTFYKADNELEKRLSIISNCKFHKLIAASCVLYSFGQHYDLKQNVLETESS